MTDPFQMAWELLKALPEQQMGYASPTGRRGTSLGSWKRTMHPAIQGIMNRRSGRQVPQMEDMPATPDGFSERDVYDQQTGDHPYKRFPTHGHKPFEETNAIAVRTPNLNDFSSVGGDEYAQIQNLPGHPAEWRFPPIEQGEKFRRGLGDDDPTPTYKERVQQAALERQGDTYE